MKNTEQWCFSIEETDGKLLTIGVLATGKVAANGVAAKEGKSETSAGRSCFGSENDGGMGCFCDWEEMKVPIRDVSASGKWSPVFFSGVSASEK